MKYNVIGLMSGTSLDGLDVCLCEFEKNENWSFKIIDSATFEFGELLSTKLRKSIQYSAIEFIELHKEFAKFCGETINNFKGDRKVDLIASHGHTSIHLPNKQLNFQLGDGAVLTAITKLPVVCDFRSVDIALGGQGAPLVPAGEKFLFNDFDAFLNIGGFANISFFQKKIIAFDICPANYVLNYYSKKSGKNFDDKGDFGKCGKTNIDLLNKLNNLTYYNLTPPKSLSDHWVFDNFYKIVDSFNIDNFDVLNSLYHHISHQISKQINLFGAKKILVTGGGAYNNFLIDLINRKSNAEIIIPQQNIIEYKEALVFAFLGLLRWLNIPNCLSSVTGAEFDNIGGAIYNCKI